MSDERRPLREMLLPTTYTSAFSEYPIVAKQFMQLAMLIAWPFFAFFAVLYAAAGKRIWGLFWPLRAYMKKHDPEAYEASQRKTVRG